MDLNYFVNLSGVKVNKVKKTIFRSNKYVALLLALSTILLLSACMLESDMSEILASGSIIQNY